MDDQANLRLVHRGDWNRKDLLFILSCAANLFLFGVIVLQPSLPGFCHLQYPNHRDNQLNQDLRGASFYCKNHHTSSSVDDFLTPWLT